MDKLKKWANEDPTARDMYETNLESLWQGIESSLEKQDRSKSFPFYAFAKAAAAVVLIAIAGMYFYMEKNDAPSGGYALHEVSPDMADTEYYYSTLYGEKMELIKASGADIDPLVFQDLASLDSIYRDLMIDLRDNADNEEVVQAMIENYRIRVQILERILEQIEEQDNTKEERDERTI